MYLNPTANSSVVTRTAAALADLKVTEATHPFGIPLPPARTGSVPVTVRRVGRLRPADPGIVLWAADRISLWDGKRRPYPFGKNLFIRTDGGICPRS